MKPHPLLVVCCVALMAMYAHGDARAWPHYGADAEGTKFSPLDQITTENVGRLKRAWTYQTGEGPVPRKFQTTPILVGEMLIGCGPAGNVFALNASSGEEEWTYDPKYEPSAYGAVNMNCRGVSMWTDQEGAARALCHTRVIYGTNDLRVIALDAATGQPCPGFGQDGIVTVDAGKPLDEHDEVQFHSPPSIVNDVAIFGTALFDLYRIDSPSGKVRAFSTRTGELLWEFDPIPRDPADPAFESWGKNSASIFGAANVWSFTSADPENDLVFLPTTTASVDWYGGDRPGNNRYANSIVALRASTGDMVWHYQIIRHGIWDYDLPAQPILADISKDGETIPAVIVLTKQSMIFVFNRLTGKPIFPIEDRPVPQDTDVPGEWLSPTQPFVSTPAPLNDLTLTEDDMWGFTWFDRNSCIEKLKSIRNEGLYTPPSIQGSLLNPAGAGGMNWGGGTVDANANLLIVPTLHTPAIVTLVPREEASAGQVSSAASKMQFPLTGTPYVGTLQFLTSSLGAPCTKPPWARLSAIDLDSGALKWQVPLGSIENETSVPFVNWEMGTPIAGGPISTGGGLTFIAATTDDKFRAFDTATGEKLWETRLPAGGQATPMTYKIDGRQFVVIAAGGHIYYQNATPGDYMVAYALDESTARAPTGGILAIGLVALILIANAAGVLASTRRP